MRTPPAFEFGDWVRGGTGDFCGDIILRRYLYTEDCETSWYDYAVASHKDDTGLNYDVRWYHEYELTAIEVENFL